MKLKQIMSWSDGYTDEVLSSNQALGYANKTIADINTTFNISLPFIETVDTDYTAITDSWFVKFMTPALSYGIKMNDGSLTEAQEYKNDLAMAFYDFESVDKSLVVEAEFITGSSTTIHQMDTSNAIDIGWFSHGKGSW